MISVTHFGLPTTAEEQHLHLDGSLSLDDGTRLPVDLFVDSGSQGNICDSTFAKRHRFPLLPLSDPREGRTISGQPFEDLITHYVVVTLHTGTEHIETLPLFVAPTPGKTITLGIPWLKRHDPTIGWSDNWLQFTSAYCHSTCKDGFAAAVSPLATEDSSSPPPSLPLSAVSPSRLPAAPLGSSSAVSPSRLPPTI
jgi:hypothetical protein